MIFIDSKYDKLLLSNWVKQYLLGMEIKFKSLFLECTEPEMLTDKSFYCLFNVPGNLSIFSLHRILFNIIAEIINFRLSMKVSQSIQNKANPPFHPLTNELSIVVK